MKFEIVNGWKIAPHQWKRYLLKPLIIDKTPIYLSIDLFGFVLFVWGV